ncbi:gp34 [Streptococcus pneumoniae]|nr:gp34 [Streptococcus pneumoniae]
MMTLLGCRLLRASNATGVLDPITGLLTEGYAVLKRDDNGYAVLEAYFTSDVTWFYPKDGKPFAIGKSNGCSFVGTVIHRPDAVRPFGRSRITRAGMYYQRYAKRTLERSDVTAEFYSFPQKYVLGLSQDAEAIDIWKATVSSLLTFTKDDEGDKPNVGQFTTSSMSPFTEQLRTAAAGFAWGDGFDLG